MRAHWTCFAFRTDIPLRTSFSLRPPGPPCILSHTSGLFSTDSGSLCPLKDLSGALLRQPGLFSMLSGFFCISSGGFFRLSGTGRAFLCIPRCCDCTGRSLSGISRFLSGFSRPAGCRLCTVRCTLRTGCCTFF
ncbi:hypothetical protein ESCCO14588_4819 [Escherichia coli O157:H7 str. TW14588]|nr:hypothetical protein ESCCO14588_4819 [Escherichia coli O157:H7 str. TW14588]